MVTFTCPTCGHERTGQRRRCYPCTKARHTAESRAQISASLLGHPVPEGHMRKMVAARFAKGRNFDIASVTRGKPAHNRAEVGHRRIANGHYQVKCADGRFRYEHRVVWMAAHGPIPSTTVIHHINHDPFDNRLENLEAVTAGEHRHRHYDPAKARSMQALAVQKRLARKAAGGKY